MKRPRRRRVRPEQFLGQTTTPVFWITPDRRIAFFNAGCETLTGWPADEVVGQLCEYVADPRPGSLEALAASLCPPAEAFAGEPVCVPGLIACRTGDPQPRRLSFLPLWEARRTLAGVLGVASGPCAVGKLACGRPPARTARRAGRIARRPGTPFRNSVPDLSQRGDAASRRAGRDCASDADGRFDLGRKRVRQRARRAGDPLRERRGGPAAFVPLDCRVLTPLELEQAMGRLFGPSRGEEFFESPATLRPGTIFLAHAERLPRDVQKAVVESLRAQTAEQPGLRLIASTTFAPPVFEADERLRPDFFHLITHLCIAVPPLRRRQDDLRFLAQHLLEESNRGESRQFNGFGDDVWDTILANTTGPAMSTSCWR